VRNFVNYIYLTNQPTNQPTKFLTVELEGSTLLITKPTNGHYPELFSSLQNTATKRT